MGEPNVFACSFTSFIGVGISFEWSWYVEDSKVLDINILLPFFAIYIYCKKSKDNKWF